MSFDRGGVHWNRVDDAGNAETALRHSPFSAYFDDEQAIPDDGTRSAHRMGHIPPRRWWDHSVNCLAIITVAETGARRRFHRYSSATCSWDDCRPEQYGGQLNGNHPAGC